MIQTQQGTVSETMLAEYFTTMVNRFFKILPMWESGEQSLPTYIQSLQMELIGCHEFIPEIQYNPQVLSLLSVLEYMVNHPETDTKVIKREVFRAINICNKIKDGYK